MASSTPAVRPLLVRPGARFQCFGDGVCCTDIHALGPLTRSEARDMRKISRLSVFMDSNVEEVCLKPEEGGGCHFLVNHRCSVHGRFGPEAKPTGCARFPYGLVKTPHGGRVTTEHRCPCRTLGERPPLSVEDAERSLRDRAGRLECDSETPKLIAMSLKEDISFDRYAEIEREIMRRLAAGERAEKALGANPFPPFYEGTWKKITKEFLDTEGDDAGELAVLWFADAMAKLVLGTRPPKRARPWARGFEAGARRAKKAGKPEAMLNDWVADELWMFRWFEWETSFDVARAELVTRLAIAREVARCLVRAGVRADQATAEAIMICEVAMAADEWTKAVDSIANVPSPATALA